MSRTTTNYGFTIMEGADPVNLLTDVFPNFEDIDTDLKDVSDAAVTAATELLTGTVHALTRTDTDRSVIAFVATSNFTAGETFTVDGVQVTALTPDGQTLATGSYVIGSAVLCVLHNTLLTVYVSPAKAKDSDKLDGEDSSYYATASDLSDVDTAVGTISSKVGTGVLQTTAQNCVDAINEVNSNLSDKIGHSWTNLFHQKQGGSTYGWTTITLSEPISNYKEIAISCGTNDAIANISRMDVTAFATNCTQNIYALSSETYIDTTYGKGICSIYYVSSTQLGIIISNFMNCNIWGIK